MTRTRYKGTCPKCNKRTYAEALDVLLDHAKNPRTIRAYPCPHGNGYHATSKPDRRAAA